MDKIDFNKGRRERIRAKMVVYYILGVIEALLAIRLVLKLLGASTQSMFVDFIYNITNIFLYPFTSIFRMFTGRGIETQAVLEPANIIAMIIYALIA